MWEGWGWFKNEGDQKSESVFIHWRIAALWWSHNATTGNVNQKLFKSSPQEAKLNAACIDILVTITNDNDNRLNGIKSPVNATQRTHAASRLVFSPTKLMTTC